MPAMCEREWKLRGKFLGNLNDPQPERKNYINAKPEIAKRLLTLHNEWQKVVDSDGAAVPPKYVELAIVRWIGKYRVIQFRNTTFDNSSLESSYDD
jgi:hypothetical protein